MNRLFFERSELLFLSNKGNCFIPLLYQNQKFYLMLKRKNSGLLLIFLLALLSQTSAQVKRSAIQDWHDNKYSMFIHFGVYSELGGVWEGKPVTRGYSEQIQAHAGILTDIYEEVPSSFNPTKWNADEIAMLAKKAGMRSVVITAKHHDGFCMYHTATTRFNVVDATPFKRDIIGELAAACKKAGLHFGLYFSLIDYRLHPIANSNANPITPDHHTYNKKQITELLTNYGPISEMWFDMGSLTVQQSKEIYELVHRLQPDCMVSGRLGNDSYDFCVMGDNEYPDYKIDTPWQTPASMFDETWGYRSWQKRGEVSAKAAEKLLSLIKVVSRGGNYLLNIGPKGDGSVVPFEADVLAKMGQWLDKNQEAIYGTKANPLINNFSWGEITSRSNALYLILSGKPTGMIELSGIKGKIQKAFLLSQPNRNLTTHSGGSTLKIELPDQSYAQKEIQVVKLEFKQPYQLLPEQLISDIPPTLNFHNAIKHYSYSCIDYYNNHRSIVMQAWNFQYNKSAASPQLFYTVGEVGMEIELNWNGKEEVVRLNGSEKIPANENPGRISWGNRYQYGPIDADFEYNPGSISSSIATESPWRKNDLKKWEPISNWNDGDVVTSAAKPIQLNYLLQEITADKAQNQLIEIKSGDGIQVWLNGENLVQHNHPRDSQLNRDIILLPLKAGKNQLLIKFYNRYGYEFKYQLTGKVEQYLFRQPLPVQNLKKINQCEMKLHLPESPHETIRLNNIQIQI